VGKEKIKILMHTSPNVDSYNAQDINGRYIASKLGESLFEIHFINLSNRGVDPLLLKTNIVIHNIYKYSKILRRVLFYYYKFLHRYDISFYIRVFRSDSSFLKLKRITDPRRKTIHTVESMVPYLGDEEYNKWAKYNALHSDYTFSISSKVQKTVQENYGIATPIMHVGVDTRIFRPLVPKPQKNRLRVVGCGTLSKMKQPILFPNIAREFPNVDFVWIGQGELKEVLLEMSKDIKNFTLKDNMPHAELARFFAESDIFLFPSLHEGFPKVVVESMACGLPVIVFDRYGPEAVINNVTGFVVSNEEEMKMKLKLLIEDNKLRNKMSQEAVKRAREFDWGIIVKKWESIIARIIRGEHLNSECATDVRECAEW